MCREGMPQLKCTHAQCMVDIFMGYNYSSQVLTVHGILCPLSSALSSPLECLSFALSRAPCFPLLFFMAGEALPSS